MYHRKYRRPTGGRTRSHCSNILPTKKVIRISRCLIENGIRNHHHHQPNLRRPGTTNEDRRPKSSRKSTIRHEPKNGNRTPNAGTVHSDNLTLHHTVSLFLVMRPAGLPAYDVCKQSTTRISSPPGWINGNVMGHERPSISRPHYAKVHFSTLYGKYNPVPDCDSYQYVSTNESLLWKRGTRSRVVLLDGGASVEERERGLSFPVLFNSRSCDIPTNRCFENENIAVASFPRTPDAFDTQPNQSQPTHTSQFVPQTNVFSFFLY